jgi:hypothetical protein
MAIKNSRVVISGGMFLLRHLLYAKSRDKEKIIASEKPPKCRMAPRHGVE